VTEETDARAAERLFREREARLRGVDLFHMLSNDELRKLAETTRQRIYARGEVIVRQQDTTSELFILVTGEVVVTVHLPGTEDETEVARLGPGEFFGEMALLTGDLRRATVRAHTSCELLEVGRSAVQSLLERSPDLAERMSAVLAARQAELGQQRGSREEADEGEPLQRKEQLLERIRKFLAV
jgi:CRP-like cAMP-binding protein